MKPENLLLSSEGHVKISDFGTSKFCEDGDDTVEGTVGTRSFYAPEICGNDGKPYSGRKADIWALGVTLYMFIFGDCPFHGESFVDLYHAITTEELHFPQGIHVTEELKVGLAWCCAGDAGLCWLYCLGAALVDVFLGLAKVIGVGGNGLLQ